MYLCADDLNIASLFEETRIKVSHAVMLAISFIVAGLDQPETLVSYLESLVQLPSPAGLR